MRIKTLKILLGALVALTLFLAGGVVGFGKGFDAAIFTKSGDAGLLVAVLQRLRTERGEEAILLLESMLDSRLVDNKVTRSGYRSVFNLPRLVGLDAEPAVDHLASTAIRYRAEFPSTSPQAVSSPVAGALEELESRVKRER